MIEAKTYRHRGHSRNDPGRYRSQEELESWLRRDPITRLRSRLMEEGALSEEGDAYLIAEINGQIDGAIEAARNAPEPDPEALLEFVFDNDDVVLQPENPGDASDGGEAISYRDAVREALFEEMQRDSRVVLFGEDVAAAGGVFKTTPGLLSEFGTDRVRDTPISENAILGAAIGAAIAGLKPVVEIMFADFLANAFDQLVNHAAKLRYMSGGQLSLSFVVRSAHGGGIGFAAQHSQAASAWLLSFPGLKVVAPATATDAKLLLKASIRDPNPVLFLEHKALYSRRDGALEGGQRVAQLGQACIRREGRDVTIVSLAGTVAPALAAAEVLASEGISGEVIDLRSVVPVDSAAVFASVEKTGRLVVVQEEPEQGGWAAFVVSQVAQHALERLTSPPVIVAGANSPVPYSPVLEAASFPTPERITAAAKKAVFSSANEVRLS